MLKLERYHSQQLVLSLHALAAYFDASGWIGDIHRSSAARLLTSPRKRIATGRYDCFHGWSGKARGASGKKKGHADAAGHPDFHRDKGRKPRVTKRERTSEMPHSSTLAKPNAHAQRVLDEYDLADLILVFSQAAKGDISQRDSMRIDYSTLPRGEWEEYPLGSPQTIFG
jgi:hypothetical protein